MRRLFFDDAVGVELPNARFFEIVKVHPLESPKMSVISA
jgi:hypothetical protein